MDRTEVLSGSIWSGDGFTEGYVLIENGIVREVGIGKPDMRPTFKGIVLPAVTDTHVHTGDAGLVLDRRYGLEELVAPPNGLKHRYLAQTPESVIGANMRRYTQSLRANGVSRFMDFREGGVKGSSILRNISKDAVILGRPISPEFDVNEVESILKIADGIGIPSVTDMDHRYIERVADTVRKHDKILALHVSERIREDIDFVLSLQPDLLVHMVQADGADLKKCADAGVPISVCASSNLYFGMVPPIKAMIDAGIDVSIGTDNAMLAPSADIFNELRIFNKVLKEQGGDEHSSLYSLVACGKKILYEESALEEMTGKRADLVMFPCTEKQLLTEGTKAIRYGH